MISTKKSKSKKNISVGKIHKTQGSLSNTQKTIKSLPLTNNPPSLPEICLRPSKKIESNPIKTKPNKARKVPN